MIDKELIGIFLLILILFLIWREGKNGKESHKLALFLILASNNWNPEPQSPEISLFIRILALIVICLILLLFAWYMSGGMSGEI
jgi:ABC-type phosphate transport system permease subunit